MRSNECLQDTCVFLLLRVFCRFHRRITCKTYLLRMHVPSQMAEHMLPPAPPAQQTGEGYSALFKVPVTLVDEQGKHWMVQYEGSSYRDQKHPRLTRGWRDFVRANNIQIGE